MLKHIASIKKSFPRFPSRSGMFKHLPSSTGGEGLSFDMMKNQTNEVGEKLVSPYEPLMLTSPKRGDYISLKLATCFFFIVFCFYSCVPAFPQSVDISIIESIESNGNDSAVSDRGAYGAFQITKIALADFNRQNKTNIKFSQLRDKELSAHIAIWLLEVRAPQLLKEKDSIRNRLISYNCGASCVGKKLPKETRNYINHYKNKGGKL